MKKNFNELWRAKKAAETGNSIYLKNIIADQDGKISYGGIFLTTALVFGVAAGAGYYQNKINANKAVEHSLGSNASHAIESGVINTTPKNYSNNIMANVPAIEACASEIKERISNETPMFGGSLEMSFLPRTGDIKTDYEIQLRQLGTGSGVIEKIIGAAKITPEGDVWKKDEKNKQTAKISFENYQANRFDEDIGNFKFFSAPNYRFKEIYYLPDGRGVPDGMYVFGEFPVATWDNKSMFSYESVCSMVADDLQKGNVYAFPNNLRREIRDWGAIVPGSVNKKLSSGAYRVAAFGTRDITDEKFNEYFNLIVNGDASSR